MEVIYKYPLEAVDRQTVRLPRGARILCVQNQRETPCLWAVVTVDVESKPPNEFRTFLILGTGHPQDKIPADNYIGTFQLDEGTLVFHVFEDLSGAVLP